MMPTKNNSILWMTLALWLLLLVPWVFTQGIFVDGLYYGTIARNWYFEGTGTWNFYLSKTQFQPFYSHPPLAFWLQGAVFSIVGDVWYCDRLYSALMCIATGSAIFGIWSLFYRKQNVWLPLLCWLLIPTVLWSYSNNILENTLTAACTWAVYWALSAVKQEKYGYLRLVAAGIFTFLGLMTKGPAAAFPLALPFLYFLCYRQKVSLMLIFSLLLPTITVFLCFGLLLFFDTEAAAYFQVYWQIQVLGSLSNRSASIGSHFFILYKLLEELLILSLLVVALLLYQNRRNNFRQAIQFFHNKQALLFLLIALSASLPILISPKQMGFYLLPSTPFWALATASLFHQNIKQLLAKQYLAIKKLSTIVTLFLFRTTLSLSIFNYRSGYARDKALLLAIDNIIEKVPERQQLDMSYSLYEEWILYGYFYRSAYISLEATATPLGNYYLLKKGEKIKLIGYEELELNASGAAIFRLYQKK